MTYFAFLLVHLQSQSGSHLYWKLLCCSCCQDAEIWNVSALWCTPSHHSAPKTAQRTYKL